ncbi:EAL domain-containing protein [Solicola sp. PLA-1-18]|uniref:EAL domain-containing protein n=1 Tax=Solicola sp. PLA-1-18 TaxID=3380532 RepID=UPI003B793A18
MPPTTAPDPLAAVLALCDDPGLLRLVVQPVVDLASGAVAGWEALSRAPTAWGIGPEPIFEAAREHGLSSRLESVVVRRALDLLDRLPDDTFLTVNVDPLDVGVPEVMDPMLDRHCLARLVVEVTEHAWPDDRERVTKGLDALRSRGALIAADDVGAGYASLNQLMRLRPQIVKLDKELIADLGHDPAAEAMVRSLGHLCGTLDAWVVAEGVETVAQLDALVRLGVPLAQGWLLGRPAAPWVGLDDPATIADRVVTGHSADSLAALMLPVDEGFRRDDLGRWRSDDHLDPVTTFAPTTTLREAVDRAVARRPEQRWSPLLVTDAAGRAVGVVLLETLLAAALDRTPSED